MDILYSLGQATATEIHGRLPDPPTFSATRAVIRTLQEKGHVRFEVNGMRYVYYPTVAVESARKSALAHVVSTFFNGSPTRLMAALLDHSKVSEEELQSLEALVRKARKESK
jgi:predicted transcriptional regulator